MTGRERFVHFVVLFAPKGGQDPLVEEALGMGPIFLTEATVDSDGDLERPVVERPMDAAWEFVQHRLHGATRPYWYPAIIAPETKLIR